MELTLIDYYSGSYHTTQRTNTTIGGYGFNKHKAFYSNNLSLSLSHLADQLNANSNINY